MAAVSLQFYRSWRTRLDSFLADKVVYLPATPAAPEQSLVSEAAVLLLSRGCYRESIVSYPIAAVSELRKVLQQQAEPGQYHFIGDLQDGSRKVLTVAVFPQYLAHCQAARLVLPISLLVASSAQSGHGAGFVEAVTADCRFYLQTTADGLWQSVAENQLIDSAARARLALGVPADTQVQLCQLAPREQLSATLSQIPLRFWRSCLQQKASAASTFDMRPLLYGAAVLLVTYLALSSFYLSNTLQQRQQQFASLLTETERMNIARQQLEQDEALLSYLAAQQTKPGLQISFWSVLAGWQLSKVQLSSIETDFNQVTLQGEAASATEVLQQLLDSPYVKDASFTSSVRRDAQGREAFTLALTLQDYVAVTPASTNPQQPLTGAGEPQQNSAPQPEPSQSAVQQQAAANGDTK